MVFCFFTQPFLISNIFNKKDCSKKIAMKKFKLLFSLLTFTFLFTATTCESDEVETTCEDRISELQELKTEIDELIALSICTESSECKVIAFGSKPCGGPWEYLVYSSSIDEEQLEALVETYNILEEDYNLNCDTASDCMFVTEPTELACEDGKCIIVN